MAASECVVFLRDRFLDSTEEARVSLFDRGYLLGDSAFETLRAYHGRVFGLDAHVRRLGDALQALDIPSPTLPSSVASLAKEAVARLGVDDAYLRITVSRGVGGAGIAITGEEVPTFSIVARPSRQLDPSVYQRGIPSTVVSARAVPAACLPTHLKTGNYLPNILARHELTQLGLLEGVRLSVDGEVVSGAVSNVFLLKDGRLVTPHRESGARLGVTREVVLELARAAGLAVDERAVRADELARADELFFTSTAIELLSVARLGDRAFDPAFSIARQLHAAYRARIGVETRSE